MNDINFDELKGIIDAFPKLPKWERSMIEIGGCHNDENVNSDYLAFFLKAEEEHGLGRLFFDSLLEVLKLDSDFQGEYEVKREKGRIDILIQSKSDNWAIIIENKIYHHLNNDLQDYWDSVKKVNEENRKGVILSLRKEHEKYHNCFKNITHKELIIKIKEKLGQNITNCNPKYLPFLRDFILNVENYYFYYKNAEVMNENLFLYSENYKLFKEIETRKKNAILFIEKVINDVLGEIGFVSKNNSGSEHRYYHFNQEFDKNEQELNNFRFYINIELLLSNNISFTFEFKDNSYQEKYDNLMSSENKKKSKQISGHEVNTKYLQLIGYFHSNFLEKNDDLCEKISRIIKKIQKEIFPLIKNIDTTPQ